MYWYSNISLYNIFTIDFFHDKRKGIFTLLNDECALQSPLTANFEINLKNAWQKDSVAPISLNVGVKISKGNMFLIRHFSNDVVYSTVCYSTLIIVFFRFLIPECS